MALRRVVISNYPVFAHIDLTSFCILRCPGCPTGRRLGLRPPVAITWELYRSIIDEIGDYLFRLELYNWGEPLLHKQTPQFIQYAKTKEMKVNIHTNLSMILSDEYVESLVKSGLDQLVVSADGATQETYEKYRRGGNLSLVRENMMRIQSVKKSLGMQTPTISWKFLVFLHNQHEIEIAKDNYQTWGADDLIMGGGFTDSKTEVKATTIAKYNIYSPGKPSKTKPKRRLGTNRTCTWLYGALVLNANGSISPCCCNEDEKDDFAKYSPSLGFLDAWNSDRFRGARSLFSKPRKHKNKDAHAGVKWPVVTKGLDGLEEKLGDSPDENALYCRRCPLVHVMPWQMDFPTLVLDQAFKDNLRLFYSNRDLRSFISLILLLSMGAFPFWQHKPLRFATQAFAYARRLYANRCIG